jgi:hypothetical protein
MWTYKHQGFPRGTYFAGHSLCEAQRLIELPHQADAHADPLRAFLSLMIDAFDRLIRATRTSFEQGKINFFD